MKNKTEAEIHKALAEIQERLNKIERDNALFLGIIGDSVSEEESEDEAADMPKIMELTHAQLFMHSFRRRS